MITTKRVTKAAGAFYRELTGQAPPTNSTGAEQDIYGLVLAAFSLYNDAWGRRWNIGEWAWPADQLRDSRTSPTLRQAPPFVGSQPWTVLLREALRLAALCGGRP